MYTLSYSNNYIPVASTRGSGSLTRGLSYCFLNWNHWIKLLTLKLSIYFDGKWLACKIEKDENGWYLVDDNGHLLGLRPGVKVRLFA